MTLKTADHFGTTTRAKTFRKHAEAPDAPACPTWRPAQAAAYLGCSVRAVWRLAERKAEFPRPFKLGHRTTVFMKAEIIAWKGRSDAAKAAADTSARRWPDGLVTYFVRSGDRGPVKIGRSEKLASRMQRLCANSPTALRLVGWLEGDREAELHERFSVWRLHGEWFRPVPELIQFIRQHAKRIGGGA